MPTRSTTNAQESKMVFAAISLLVACYFYWEANDETRTESSEWVGDVFMYGAGALLLINVVLFL